MKNRFFDAWASFRTLPRWVQAWVGLCLVPVNLAPFFMLHTATGRAGALAMSVVIVTNVPILLWERGMSKRLSLPHLLAWIPLCLWLGLRLMSDAPMSPRETALAWTLLVIDLMSLAFDAIDSAKWFCGDRAIASAASHENTH
ncbi:MAG: hypothetical protein KA144_08775 [Xanthomonadaceae bacterium]|nr:hypothetical protein [Xanthomonadaceae bacterium]